MAAWLPFHFLDTTQQQVNELISLKAQLCSSEFMPETQNAKLHFFYKLSLKSNFFTFINRFRTHNNLLKWNWSWEIHRGWRLSQFFANDCLMIYGSLFGGNKKAKIGKICLGINMRWEVEVSFIYYSLIDFEDKKFRCVKFTYERAWTLCQTQINNETHSMFVSVEHHIRVRQMN